MQKCGSSAVDNWTLSLSKALMFPQGISLSVQVMLHAPLTFCLRLRRFVHVIARHDAVTWMLISSMQTAERPAQCYLLSLTLTQKSQCEWLSQRQLGEKMHIVSKVQQLLWCWKAWAVLSHDSHNVRLRTGRKHNKTDAERRNLLLF